MRAALLGIERAPLGEEPEMNWQEAIKELQLQKCMSLRQLAPSFGIGHVFLSAVAKGASPASPMLKLKILSALGRKIGREELLLLLPEDVANEVARLESKSKNSSDDGS
jgi:hypothetical protein